MSEIDDIDFASYIVTSLLPTAKMCDEAKANDMMIVSVIPTLFYGYPRMWLWALGISNLTSHPNLIMYAGAGVQYSEAGVQSLKTALVESLKGTSLWTPPAHTLRGVINA